MKMVVLASLLASAGAAPLALTSVAQAGDVQMQPEEYAKYQTCSTAAAGAAQATACQAYLTAYPNSSVKKNVLSTIMFDYVQAGDNKSLIPAADAVLAADPNNLPAYVFEAQARMQTGDAAGAADNAKKGLALGQAGLPDAQFATIKAQGYPVMYSAVGNGALAAKDYKGAIDAFKQELASVPVDATTKPGLQLQDTYNLATAYYKSDPADYVNCAFYAARGGDYAPEPYKTTFNQLAKFCYTKFHGNSQGFDAVSASAQTNLNPPSDFTITPAPKPEDLVAQLLSSTTDLTALAPSDREFVLQYGTDEQKAKVFDAVKGKSAKFPDVLVVSATADKVMAAVSDDAVQGGVADYEFDMKTPLKTPPAEKTKVTLIGTYSSYTVSPDNKTNPVSIVMTDAEVVTKAPAKTAPTKRTTTPARKGR